MGDPRPINARRLNEAIRRLGGGDEGFVAKRSLMANAIVGQLLPNGAVKGGSALKLRFGDSATRATSDLDAAREGALDSFVEDLEESLAEGWEGFSGRVVRRGPASPRGVPPRYVMQPFEVKLSYRGKPWCTVELELGHDEAGDAEGPDMIVPAEASGLLRSMGFPELGPVPVMPLHHQIAQKLHGVTGPGSMRAHDLIDLQVIVARGDVDYPLVRRTCERLFAYRALQPWPSEVRKQEGWDGLYESQALGTVLPTVGEAVDWANELIGRIASS